MKNSLGIPLCRIRLGSYITFFSSYFFSSFGWGSASVDSPSSSFTTSSSWSARVSIVNIHLLIEVLSYVKASCIGSFIFFLIGLVTSSIVSWIDLSKSKTWLGRTLVEANSVDVFYLIKTTNCSKSSRIERKSVMLMCLLHSLIKSSISATPQVASWSESESSSSSEPESSSLSESGTGTKDCFF